MSRRELDESDDRPAIKAPKLKEVLGATWLGASRIVAQLPNCSPLELAESEAAQLGDAWATYIDSIPAKKAKATRELISRIMPGLVALGTTFAVFAPRVIDVQAGLRGARPQRRPPVNPEAYEPRRTQPPEPQWQAPPEPPHVVEEDPDPPRPQAPRGPDDVLPDRRGFIEDSAGHDG